MTTPSPLIIGIGGTTRAGSTSERVLVKALEAAERAGARTALFGGLFLSKLPIYDPATAGASEELAELLDGVRRADGVLIATPGYHGSISGLNKNALDSLEGLRDDPRLRRAAHPRRRPPNLGPGRLFAGRLCRRPQ